MKILQHINQKALQVATVTFGLGTIIVMMYITSNAEPFLVGAVFYACIALALNAILFIELLINAFVNRHCFRENLITIFIFLCNIPIALGYVFLVIKNPL